MRYAKEYQDQQTKDLENKNITPEQLLVNRDCNFRIYTLIALDEIINRLDRIELCQLHGGFEDDLTIESK